MTGSPLAASSARTSRPAQAGSRPFWRQLLKKMSAKLGRQDAPDAEVEQGPRGVLPGAAAPEVAPAQEDGRLPVGRAVEHELRALPAPVVEPQIVEEVAAEALPGEGLQELLRDDLVRVHVLPEEGRRDAGVLDEGLHGSFRSQPR